MRTSRSRLARLEHDGGKRRWLLELDHDLVDGDIRAADITEVPLDPFARPKGDVFRIDADVHASATHLDVDADGHGPRHEFGHVFRSYQAIGRRRRSGDERWSFRARRRRNEGRWTRFFALWQPRRDRCAIGMNSWSSAAGTRPFRVGRPRNSRNI